MKSFVASALLSAVLLVACTGEDHAPPWAQFEPPQRGACEAELVQIAEGRSQASITELTFEAGERRIILDDPEALSYFQTQLQDKEPWRVGGLGDRPFWSYDGYAELDNGCVASMPIGIQPPEGYMRITFWQEGMVEDNYDVSFDDPPVGFSTLQTILLDPGDDLGLGDEVRVSEILRRWDVADEE